MPSSPNYIRNYKQEAADEDDKRRAERRARIVARRNYEAQHGTIPAGFDLDHRKPLSKGGSNFPSNLGLQRSGANRSYPRTKTGAMKSRYD